MIRAITIGVPDHRLPPDTIAKALLEFSALARRKLEARGWPLRTLRLSLSTLKQADEDEAFSIPARLSSLGELVERAGIRWFCLPVDLTKGEHYQRRLDAAFATLFKQPKMFVNLMVADEQGINIRASHDIARFILDVAHRSNNGFDNFRVGASCCCPANAPFFPCSRHEGDDFKFSFALETTDIALQLSTLVAEKKITLTTFADRLIKKLSARLSDIHQFGQALASASGMEYAGLDASLAPFPDGNISVGRLLTNLGVMTGSSHGVIFITSILTNAIKKAVAASGVTATGFNGVMFSVLEDNALASANNCRMLSIETLNSWSTVCGCGLDMIPIPGSTLAEDISAIILDTAALAVRLNKPLGIRLLPIPGKEVNEFTEFNFDFLCNSRVMQIAKSDVILPKENERWVYR